MSQATKVASHGHVHKGKANISITRSRLQRRGLGLSGNSTAHIILLESQMEKAVECQRRSESRLRPRQVTSMEFRCESPQVRGQAGEASGSELLPSLPGD